MPRFAPLLLVAVLLALAPAASHAEGLYSLQGEGMQLIVTEATGDDGFTGVLVREGGRYPMRFTTTDDGGRGTFDANGDSFPFTYTINDDATVAFTTGNTTYTLRGGATTTVAVAADGPGAAGRHKGLKPPAGSVVMKYHTIQDPALSNIDSHTLLVPEGWTVEGGPMWTPAFGFIFCSNAISVAAPDGRQLRVLPSIPFTYWEAQPQTQQLPEVGQLAGEKIFMPPPQSHEAFVVDTLMPGDRPEATNIRVAESGRYHPIEQSIADSPTWAEQFRQARQLDAQASQTAQMSGGDGGYKMSIEVPYVLVQYNENGKAYEELFMWTVNTTHTYSHTPPVAQGFPAYSFQSWNWGIWDGVACRAPAGELEQSLPLMVTIKLSLKPTQRWHSIYAQIQQDIAKMKSEEQRRNFLANQKSFEARQKALVDTGDSILDMQMDSWKKRQESDSASSRAFTNAITGVDDYRMPDGSSQSLDSSYDRVFTNSTNDSFIFTNDAMAEPDTIGGWQEVKAIDPMGGAANE